MESILMKLFVHRKDVYAVQVRYGEKFGYIPKYQVLTETDIQSHLEGKVTLGVYALNVDNTVRWICFDIDSQHVKKPEETRNIIFKRCVERFGEDSVRVEESGTAYNYHVWVFFKDHIQACYARALGHEILEAVENVELFPKQNTLRGKRLGNLVKLPLGYHNKSRAWSKIGLEGVKPCTIDVDKIEIKTPRPKSFTLKEPLMLNGYKGEDPNCIEKIKKGVKKGARNNTGIIYASYLINFRRSKPDHAFYLFRFWNAKNKPKLSNEELGAIFQQAIEGGYVFGCGHEYLKDYCDKEGCVFA